MFEPAGRDAAVADLIAGQLLQYFHLGAGMAEHVHKVINDDVEIVVQEIVNIVYQVLPGLVVKDLGYKRFSAGLFSGVSAGPGRILLQKDFCRLLHRHSSIGKGIVFRCPVASGLRILRCGCIG